jgi:hypothetical protein
MDFVDPAFGTVEIGLQPVMERGVVNTESARAKQRIGCTGIKVNPHSPDDG